MALIAKYAGIRETEIPLDKEGMRIVTGRTKEKRAVQ
jgi:hypothetical protein